MPLVNANGIEIAYESHGDAADPTILLIMGLGGQLAMWPTALIDTLVDAGHHVVTFDNRDIGLSTKHDGTRVPNLIWQVVTRRLGVKLETPYTLKDMADDAAGLMDALEIDRAHVAGVSMGGMIGQHLAAHYPGRVRTLSAIMTTTGNPNLPRPSGDVIKAVFRAGPPPTTREAIIDRSVRAFSLIGTPGEDHDTNGTRERITASYERNYSPASLRRQTAAIIASGDFRHVTRRIKAPTLVLHGSVDPLVPIEGGHDIARIVPGARMEVIDGMGHDLPPRFVPQLAGHMLDHIRQHS